MQTLQAVAVADIQLSKTNPREGIHPERLKELTASVRQLGVLEPVILRPLEKKNGKAYELVCGQRRLQAARAAELAEIPAIVRPLNDQEALELQLVENLQREDLHPLDEAAGYRQLMARAKYDVARIAERIGRSVKYVYDRVKLLQLAPEAKKLFLEDRISAGIAILLARLKPADQKRALEDGIFEHEDLLWSPQAGGLDSRENRSAEKARSVREVQGWIDQHVKFDVEAPDLPDLFPETATAVASAEEQKRKVIPITYEAFVQSDARDKNRIFGPRSWKRADGKEGRDDFGRKVKSKTCERSGLGVIMTGPGRGEALEVCVSRSCEIHFPQSAKKKRAAASAGGEGAKKVDTAEQRWQQQQAQRQEAERKRAQQFARFNKARSVILEAVAAAVKKASAGAGGPLAQVLISRLRLSGEIGSGSGVSTGGGAEDLVRNLAFRILASDAASRWGHDGFVRTVKGLGVDVGKLVNEHAPVAQPAAKKAAKKKARGRP